MEIEFIAQINPQEKKYELHAGLAFAAASMLFLLLLVLLFQKAIPSSKTIFLVISPIHLVFLNQYRRMREQEKFPDQISIRNNLMIYSSKGKKSLSISMDAIARVEYEKGLMIFFKRPLSKRLEILDPGFSLSSFLSRAKRKKCDLFFEWFSKENAETIDLLRN